ncbi:hypothetical protein CXF68_09835 [Tenacibaculum sp. Bg11-29]|uniref:nuclear transport factor 2 family protein n=1 Tax=Tenacibaculum sp. Bg11-29 TaxID=2058306 RepID=UPI000C332922|nr:nuclear transport factor 2 family protein [Tenacibaculum sp. Bg11-29]PKH50965.1 hypothetical protein CXF68_09835 [Tenacibaculum sp. Bg11-29]
MKQRKHLLSLFIVFTLVSSCNVENKKSNNFLEKQNEKAFTEVMLKHLKAVSDKNMETLKITLSPKGDMELIQPNMEIIYSVNGFLKFHEPFLKDSNSALEFKITSKNIGDRIGVATTEAIYKEFKRNGKPYFNRLIVTYTLEKIKGKWYVIKDHASSIEKTKS